jgi:hypothetical protein
MAGPVRAAPPCKTAALLVGFVFWPRSTANATGLMPLSSETVIDR